MDPTRERFVGPALELGHNAASLKHLRRFVAESETSPILLVGTVRDPVQIRAKGPRGAAEPGRRLIGD